ncbi:MAG TPA: response regulator [Blastocatellia bacterium]|nr:response regulator [Blastocatellia bacterium]
MKILIIDDEDDIRLISRMSLSRIGGMEVIDASNGADGVRKAEAEMPDAILLDVMMPSMDGPTTLSALRANQATAAIPVIFLTAKAMASEVERLRALDVAGVLTKPFDPRTLSEQVRQALTGRSDRIGNRHA